MNDRLFPDPEVPGAFAVKFGSTMQSWVDPTDPEHLAFEYVQNISAVLESCLFPSSSERLRVVHVGGAGMSVPRWIAARRPGTAQIVCEPDTALTDEVRRKLPLPPRSGIKVRAVDGLAGVAAMPTGYADAVIIDAFDDSQVPAELATIEFLQDVARIGRGAKLVVFNATDRLPFHWSKALAAGIVQTWPNCTVGAENAVWKGKRFGNLLLVAAEVPLNLAELDRRSRRLPFGYSWLTRQRTISWQQGAVPHSAQSTQPSPKPSGNLTWFG